MVLIFILNGVTLKTSNSVGMSKKPMMRDIAYDIKTQSRCLLHADWMHRLALSKQRGASSVNCCSMAHEIPAADAGRFESCIS